MSGVSPVDVDAVRTVCLMLGPYRNLTTLTAAIVGLHPNCQVLNHGGMQVFRNNTINFLGDYSDERFEAFIRFAVGGRRARTARRVDHPVARVRSAVSHRRDLSTALR